MLTGIFGMLQSQTRYMCKNGFVGFYSKTAMEEIKGDNNQTSGIIDGQTGQIVINVLVKSFKFDRALMEEHFNENYVESDKFPKSTFKGNINNLKDVDFKKDGTYSAAIDGEMTIHGVTKPLKTKGEIEVKGETITAKAKFLLNPVDYGIDIPSVVREKIADNMEITVNMAFVPMKK
jgi:polyisoprenoid-binding protein YceI